MQGSGAFSRVAFCQVEVFGTSYEMKDSLTPVPVTVTFVKFFMPPAEVTQRDFKEVMGYNPSFHKGSDLPVETVDRRQALEYRLLQSPHGAQANPKGRLAVNRMANGLPGVV